MFFTNQLFMINKNLSIIWNFFRYPKINDDDSNTDDENNQGDYLKTHNVSEVESDDETIIEGWVGYGQYIKELEPN